MISLKDHIYKNTMREREREAHEKRHLPYMCMYKHRTEKKCLTSSDTEIDTVYHEIMTKSTFV